MHHYIVSCHRTVSGFCFTPLERFLLTVAAHLNTNRGPFFCVKMPPPMAPKMKARNVAHEKYNTIKINISHKNEKKSGQAQTASRGVSSNAPNPTESP